MEDTRLINERRHFKRFTFSEPVNFVSSSFSKQGGCIAMDVSSGGLRVNLFDFMPLQSKLTIQIYLTAHKLIECQCRIIWIEKSRYGENYQAGLEFFKIEPVFNSLKHIHHYLKTH